MRRYSFLHKFSANNMAKWIACKCRGKDEDNAIVSESENTPASEHTHLLIDGVWCLHCCDSAILDIVFISGPRTEWRARSDDSILWPASWLPRPFPEARVLVVDVKFELLQTWEAAINIIQCLKIVGVGTRPYYLIGHSLGGLLVKEILLRADNNYREKGMALNCKGVVFYGVPHLPDHTCSSLETVSKIMGISLSQWEQWCQEENFRSNLNYQPLQLVYPAYYFVEGKLTKVGTEKARVCSNQSAAYSADASRVAFVMDSDHLEICRPESTTSVNFALLVDFINKQGFLRKNDRRPPKNDGRLSTKNRRLQGDLKDYVSLEKKVRQLKVVIEPMLSSEAVLGMLAFNGMGGIGKTTLAAAFFDDEIVEMYFTHFAWVEVGYNPSKTDIRMQQASLYRQLSGKTEEFLDAAEGAAVLRTWMSNHRSEKILVVLDNVWEWEHTNGDYSHVPLVGKDVPSGSCMILTTRDSHVVRAANAKCYMLNLLDAQEALDLIYLTANVQKSLELESVLKDVADRCKYLPLALSTLGNLGRAEGCASEVGWWKSVSSQLDKGPLDNVNKALLLSFSAAGPDLQLLFLLVVAFLPLSRGRLAAYLSALLGESEMNVFRFVKNISDRSLISCSSLDGLLQPRQWSLSCKEAATSGIVVHDLFRDVAVSKLEPGKLANGRRSFCFDGHLIISDSDVAVEWETAEPLRSVSVGRVNVMPFLPRLLCMPTLRSLVLTECHLPCPVPSELSALTNLVYLDLEDNECELHCPISSELSALKNLAVLNLHSRHMKIRGSIPSQLSALTNLTVFRLSYNHCLCGSIPHTLSALTSLTHLELSHNNLSGPIPPQISTLTNITYLDLAGNCLSGPIPPQLSALTNLTYLNLSSLYNQLSGPIPPQLSALTNLTYLDFSSNKLSGPIPPQLSALTNLTYLDLAMNQNLSGPIPSQLSALTNLTELNLYINKLSGPIPPQLSALTKLTKTYLYNNNLSGSIPSQLSSLKNLEILHLSNNQLSGPIPTHLSALTNLQQLTLEHNQLCGLIPTQLSVLTNLERVSLGGNELSGPIPRTKWQHPTDLTEFTLEDDENRRDFEEEDGDLRNFEEEIAEEKEDESGE